jgi:cell division septation protein DedD
MVPDAALDTAAVDTGATSDMESAYEAGTLPDAEGVREDPAAGDRTAQDAEAELKTIPAETEARPTPSVTRPSTSVSSGDGAYNLQLGSFTNLANARKQADRISALGYAPVIEESNLGGQIYHRVMLRGVGDMAEASRLGEYIHSELGIAYLVRRGK